jgi:hypothetical protein
MIALYCQCAVLSDGADRGGGKPELYLRSKKSIVVGHVYVLD